MKKLPSYIESLSDSVQNNSTLRFNCPECNGNNSLGITREQGKVKWHCFKCQKAGVCEYQRTSSELKIALGGRTELKTEFTLPEYLIFGLGSKKTVNLIKKYHCEVPYSRGLFDIAYDPIQDRVCFIVNKNNKIMGLVGRSINSNVFPKTLNYPNSDISTPFICGIRFDSLVLVEDCISAVSVSRIPELSGLALLGSTLKTEYVPSLKAYDTIIIALDRDARKKALAIKKKLCYYHGNVKLWWLEKDIKDMSDKELLESYKTI
jgi:hypothetical protein